MDHHGLHPAFGWVSEYARRWRVPPLSCHVSCNRHWFPGDTQDLGALPGCGAKEVIRWLRFNPASWIQASMRTWHLGENMPTALHNGDHSFSLCRILHRRSGSRHSFCMWVCKARAGTGLSALNVGSLCFCSDLDAQSLSSTLARDQAGVQELSSHLRMGNTQVSNHPHGVSGESNWIFHHFLHRQTRQEYSWILYLGPFTI